MNKATLIFVGAISAALSAVPTLSFAQIQVVRCQTVDSIGIPAANDRIEWARKCGLTLNTGLTAPKTGNPLNFFQSAKAADAATFLGANDYLENTTSQAFSNTVNTFNINYNRVWAIWGSLFAYNTFQDTSGPTLNFWNWSSPAAKRVQPFYPSFDSSVSGTGQPLFPPPNANINSPCTLFTDQGGVNPWPAGSSYFVAFYCAAGCYTADQNVRFSKGDVSMLDAFNSVRNDVVTLAPDATINDLSTQVSPVYSYTRDARDGTQPIYTVTTASGGSLSITNSHPVLVSSGDSGRLIMAEKLREGDVMLKADGTPDPIITIEKANHFGRAYNLAPTATEHISNILIAQGFLVGSSKFQTDDLKYMNRAILFRAVPDEVMPK